MPSCLQTRIPTLALCLVVLLASCKPQPPQVAELPAEAIRQFQARNWLSLQETLVEAERQIPNDGLILLLQAIGSYCHGQFSASLRSLDTIQALGENQALPAAAFKTPSVREEATYLTPLVESSLHAQTFPEEQLSISDFYCAELPEYLAMVPGRPTTTQITTPRPESTDIPPAPDHTTAGAQKYRIQLGAFGNQDNARILLDTLQNPDGLPENLVAMAQVEQIIYGSQGTRYLVFLGDFPTEGALQEAVLIITQRVNTGQLPRNRMGDGYCLLAADPSENHFRNAGCHSY